ncbi:MAG: thioredoxin domain-containing protein [Flavobacteriaceae bacterium]
MSKKYTNALINETSPYLLQHAHNPVNWEAWRPEVLERAKKDQKLLIISIGYAACHWCHVMEKECFEDEEVAEVMNRHFVNIKIDREERPDIDHIYMDALQMMTGSGGWPLNVVALPDGRPFWGATYVKKSDWIRILEQLQNLYEKEPEKILEYAQKLAEGIKAINLIPKPDKDSGIIDTEELKDAYKGWSRYFDTRQGGYNRAPKFMMPVNLDFLLHYGSSRQISSSLEYVNTTLTKMAYGGIYDHIGGGFARYSVDMKWHVPHFEKMLYDNAQLVCLYSKSYAATGNALYIKAVDETISFMQTELMDVSFGFYSSLDADSYNEEGTLEEGAFYVWTKEELQKLLGADYELFKSYFNINSYGLWEHGKYVLIQDQSPERIAEMENVSVENLTKRIAKAKKILLQERDKRDKPRLDDKILSSWNGLTLSGLIDAYRCLENPDYLDLALKNATFIRQNLIKTDGSMFHSHKNGKSSISGYLEDYATVAEAFLNLYEVTMNESWLFASKGLLDLCIEDFQDPESGLFFFTSKKDDFVIRRTLETSDNVIPSSNSIMAKTLFKMGKMFPESEYEAIAKKMFITMRKSILENVQSYANWLHLSLYFEGPFYEIVISGEDYLQKARSLQKSYLPNAIFAGADKTSELPLLQNRWVENKTLIYICQHGSCKLPVSRPKEALTQMGKD